ncbi:phosphoglycerate mutase [Desulfocarbo indianensis]|nr:phosphoglycerate mutase [Desulfocarbo indianensis]
MKYLILVGDGMGDRPRGDLGGRTVLEAAETPHMDRLAREGELGLALTIPPGKDPGSDTANMSLMGFDPAKYHTGRSPIEAAAMGVDLGPRDIAFRCNLVTLDRGDGGVIMQDYAAGHIDTQSAARFIEAVDAALGRPGLKFHPGVSYRHLLVWQDGPLKALTVPPHDRSGQAVDDVLNQGGESAAVNDLMRASWPVLADHPLNQLRRHEGKPEVSSIWLWGQGTKPSLVSFQDSYGLTGFTVSAVDLIKGLGVLAGLRAVNVPGATGFLDTDYAGKVRAVLEGLENDDLAFLHVEAPDEAGHSGKLDLKMRAVREFDQRVVGPVLEGMAKLGPHRVLLATDHYTPLEVKTHTPEPVPYVIWDSENRAEGGEGFNEKAAAAASRGRVLPAHGLIGRLVGRK